MTYLLGMKQLVGLFILFAASTLPAIGQDSKTVASLKGELQDVRTDTARARLLIELGYAYKNTTPDSGLSYATTGLALAEKLGDRLKMAQADYTLAKLYYTVSDNDRSLHFFGAALQLFEQLKDTGDMILIHSQMGYAYDRLARRAEMLNEFLAALKLAEKTNNLERTSDALYSLSSFYTSGEEFPKAIPYLQQALVIDNELGNRKNIASDYLYLGQCDGRTGKYEAGKRYLTEAISIFTSFKDNFHLAVAYSYLGDLYYQRHDYDASIQNRVKAMQMMDTLGAKEEAADVADNVAKDYLQKRDYSSALRYASQGLTLAKEVNAVTQQYYLYTSLAEADSGLGNYKDANAYLAMASVLHDTLTNRAESAKLAEMQTRFETEKQEKENLLLKAQNLVGAQQLKQNKRLLGAALIGLALLGGLLYMVYWNRQVKIRNIKKLEDLNSQLAQGKEEITRMNTLLEQKALHARMNPHFIFNCMSSVQECILTGQLDEANAYLTMLSRLLRMVLNHSDDEIVLLETELEMLNLYLQLERVRLKESFDYSICMEDEMMTEELKVPTLILQPFAENAIWHGLLNKTGNRTLRISGALTNDAVRLTIEDNGIGRKKAASLRHIKHSYKSVAIELISKRLHILREQSGFEATGFRIFDIFNHRQEPGGTKVEITLPVIN